MHISVEPAILLLLVADRVPGAGEVHPGDGGPGGGRSHVLQRILQGQLWKHSTILKTIFTVKQTVSLTSRSMTQQCQ